MNTPETLIDFMEKYQTDADCRRALFEHRWPEGFRCPRCGHDRAYLIEKRALFECARCTYQASLTVGTIFHKTRTGLKKWLLAIYLIASTKKAPSAAELARQLGISLKSAWTIRHKIMRAMSRREGELMLLGLVEMDESYVGGARKGKRGRGAEGKTPVAVMASRSNSGGLSLAHMQVVDSVDGRCLGGVALGSVAKGSVVTTDGWGAYRGLTNLGYDHEPTVQGDLGGAAELLPWVHIVISNFKRWILDVFHGVSPKHLQSYLDEFCYRLNRRYRQTDLFRRVLNRCVRFTGPVTYAELIATGAN